MKRFLLILLYICEALIGDEGWYHIELGGGNYGNDGHTKASQIMTVVKKFKEISPEKNYIDDLEEKGLGNYNPDEQFGVLFWTLDELVLRYGPKGVFHLNDLYEEYALIAVERLKDYASQKGYDSITIEPLSGDYQLIHAPAALAKYGRKQYTSAHLKNPEVSFYFERMDGEHLLASVISRAETRALLHQLASLSESGLYLFILNNKYFIPDEEWNEFMDKGVFYYPTSNWQAVPYIFPEGGKIENGIVFHID